MNKRYVIFDFDGTLVDSMPWWQKTEREYLERHGIADVPREILERVKPMTLTEAADVFIRTYGFTDSPEQIAVELETTMREHFRRDVPLKDGVKGYLDVLYRRGIRMCVASATAEELMRETLERLGAGKYFAFLISCIDIGAGKSRPDVYFAAARRLGAAPEEIAVYEDAPYALMTAKDAGFYTVGIYDASGAEHWDEVRRIADEFLSAWSDGTGPESP